MKKLIYTSAICFGLLLSAIKTTTAQVNFGVRGSINIANVRDAGFNTESITGFAAGAYASIQFPGFPIGIQPEILYTRKGFQTSTGLEDQPTDVMFNLDYIEIPLLAKIRLGGSRSFAPYIYGGTYLGLQINADAETDQFEVDVDNFNDTDYGITVGAGVTMGRLNIDARYEGGLAEVSENSDAKNGVITLAAGIEF